MVVINHDDYDFEDKQDDDVSLDQGADRNIKTHDKQGAEDMEKEDEHYRSVNEEDR